jgi:hypothetical protein
VTEALLVILSLSLGGCVVFFTVCQQVRRQLDWQAARHEEDRRRWRDDRQALDDQLKQLHRLLETLTQHK